MKELSLFSGACGGVLGTKYFLGWETKGYVEINEHCQEIISRRIKDGLLDEAPIFSDIKAFNREGFARAYKGMVDVISGGFPCQDLSCAGKGAGITGERSSMWFEMASAVRIIGPRYVFAENVPALLIRGFERVLIELSKMGYDARWGVVSAADVGAPHLRKRLWILAYPERFRLSQVADETNLCSQGDFKKLGKRLWRGKPSRCSSGRVRFIPEFEFLRVDKWTPEELDSAKAVGNMQLPQVAALAWNQLMRASI